MGRKARRRAATGPPAVPAVAPVASPARPPWALPAALFALALLVRAVYLVQAGGSAPGRLLLGDAAGYDAWAREIAGGAWVGREAFYQAPLYPYVVAVVYALAGPSPSAVYWLQALLGALSCLLLARAGAGFFATNVGFLAGALLAVYPPAIYFTGILQKPALDLFLLTALLAVLGPMASRPPSPRRAAAAGALVALLSLVRENALALVPVVAAWAAWRALGPARRRALPAVAVVAGAMLVLLPVGLRNLAVGGSFHLTTFQLGTNLYIGNNPAATGAYAPLVEGRGSWRFEREDAVRLAEAAEGRRLTAGEVSAFWTRRAVAFARAHPGPWLRLLWRKWLLVWNAVEMGDTDSQYLYGDVSPLLRGLGRVWHFGVLAPLAAAGLVLTVGDWRRLAVLYMILLAFAAAVAVFYVFARYRFPLVPVLMLFAAAGAMAAPRAWRERRWPRLGGAAAAAAVAVVVATLPLAAENETLGVGRFNVAWELELRGQAAEARRWYEAALAAYPTFQSALNNLGNLHAREGRLDEADRLFAEAARHAPRHAASRLNLGKVRATRGDLAGAVERYGEALALRPGWPEAHQLLANTLLELNRPQEAAVHFRALAALEPFVAAHQANLGSALGRAGRYDEAVAAYEQALRIDPRHVPAYTNLAYTYVRMGRLEEARRRYEEALRVDPNAPGAREALAWIERQPR